MEAPGEALGWMKNAGKTHGKMVVEWWSNGKIMGKSWKNAGKMLGDPENSGFFGNFDELVIWLVVVCLPL